MFKPKYINFNNLPLKKIGNERKSNAEVYKLTVDLNSNILLSLKSHGLLRKSEIILTNGEAASDAWLLHA